MMNEMLDNDNITKIKRRNFLFTYTIVFHRVHDHSLDDNECKNLNFTLKLGNTSQRTGTIFHKIWKTISVLLLLFLMGHSKSPSTVYLFLVSLQKRTKVGFKDR